MALTKDQKSIQLTALRDRLKKAKSVVFVSYCGLSVGNLGTYRSQLREKNAEMKVGKKTLFRIAAKEEGYPEVDENLLTGPVGFIFSYEDEMSGAKISLEFGKKNNAVAILGGVYNGKVLSKEEALELAKMLTKPELLTKFAMMIRSPLCSFASMCNSPLRGFAMGMKQVADKGGFGGDAKEVTVVEEAVVEEAKESKEAKEAEEANEESSESSAPSDPSAPPTS